MNREILLRQLNKWHKAGEYQKIVDRILEIPKEERDYELTSQLARAYNNLSRYEEAVKLLGSVASAGEKDALWHYRLGYSLFHMGRLKKALACLQAAQALDPQDGDAAEMLKRCRDRMRISSNRDSKKDWHFPDVKLYTPKELETLEAFIQKNFGECETVFHEVVSPDIRLDIAVLPPTPAHDFYTLITMGMGAYRMKIPKDLQSKRLERAELMLCLPADWKVSSHGEQWYWPIRLLKLLGRLPISDNTWLGWGHTIDNGGPFDRGTRLCGAILCGPCVSRPVRGLLDVPGEEKMVRCPMPDGSNVCFYQVLPLYREEMELKVDTNAEKLFGRFAGALSPIVDPRRRNFAEIKEYM